jgi:predicted metal-dependent peptidase
MSSLDIFEGLYRAAEQYPYYARGFAALTPVEKKISDGGENPTLGVDKYWRLYYCQEAVDRMNYNIEAVLCHELEHLLREHADRCQWRNPRGWNIAADAEINDDIEGLPAWVVMPKTLEAEEGLTAEEYYSKGQQMARESGSGEGPNFWDAVDPNGSSSGEGSGVTGQSEEWELGAPKGDEAVPDSTTADELRDAIASDVVNEAAKGRGTVPSGVLVWAEARIKGRLPRISWKRSVSDRLRRISHGRQDYSYGKMSRRQDRGQRVLLPGTIKYHPKVAVVVDTSGSMSSEADWIAGIFNDLSRMHTDVIIIDCDADVHSVRTLKSWRDVMKSRGGGGTNMTVGVERAKKEKADLVLLLTDGETPWPDPWPKNLVALIKKWDSEDVEMRTK